jgi:hypothetical protein
LTGLANRLRGGGKGEKVNVSQSDTYELNLGYRGSVIINYWALTPTDETENWRDIKKGFVTSSHAVFVTLNGQRHGIETTALLRDRVGLAYSGDYLIVQIDCDDLTNQAKKDLLSTTRDRLKEGEFKEFLLEAVVDHLRQDRNILAFEKERKTRIISAKSERDTNNIRRLVGQYIARNPELSDLVQSESKTKVDSTTQPKDRSVEKDEITEDELVVPELHETPTCLRVVNKRTPIPVEKGGNGLVRLETDAMDGYWEDEWNSRFRALHKSQIMSKRSCSRLRNGKISYHVHCPSAVSVGTKESIRFELDLKEGGTLVAECTLECVPPFERKKEEGKKKLPEPKITCVKKEDSQLWGQFGWDDDSVGRVMIAPQGGESGIYVSLDNRHIRKAVTSRRFEAEVTKAVEDRYAAGIAYYLLLREADHRKKKENGASEDTEMLDNSPELTRLARTLSVMSIPIESL